MSTNENDFPQIDAESVMHYLSIIAKTTLSQFDHVEKNRYDAQIVDTTIFFIETAQKNMKDNYNEWLYLSPEGKARESFRDVYNHCWKNMDAVLAQTKAYRAAIPRKRLIGL